MTKESASKFSALTLFVLCVAQVGTSGDNSVLGFATQQLMAHLNASMDQVQMANIVYSLLAGALMVFGGMAGIAWGFKRVFVTGALLCAIGEFLAIISPTINIFVWGARTVTGLGAALMIPSVLGIIVSLFQGKDRVFAFGAIGGATGIAVIVMPLGAGAIMDTLGYKIAFAIMSIWFIVVFIGGLLFIPSIKPAKMKVDFVGTILTFIGLVLFIVGCAKISTWGFITPREVPEALKFLGISPALPVIILGVIVMLCTLAFEYRVEKSKGSALIPSSFTKTPEVRAGLYVTGLIFAVLGACLFLVPNWIMVVAGESSMSSAIMIVFLAVPMIVFSLLLPKKYSWLSPRLVIMVSSVALLVGFLLLAVSVSPNHYSPLMYLGLFLCGCGLGGYSAQSAMIVAAALNPRDAAQSGGVQCSVRNVWQAAAVAIIGAVFLSGLTSNFKDKIAESSLSQPLKQAIEQRDVITLVGNHVMEASLVKDGFKGEEITQAMEMYTSAEVSAVRYAFLASFLIVLLHIPGFRRIQTKGWSERRS